MLSRSQMTPDTSLLEFLEGVYLPSHLGMAASSVEQLTISVMLFSTIIGRTIKLADLNDGSVIEFLQLYRKTGKSEKTVNNKRGDMLAIWRWAHKKEYVNEGPRDVPKLRERRRCPRAWSLEEFCGIVSSARLLRGHVGIWPTADWFEALLLTCYSTAPRISAVMALKTADVNLDTGILFLLEPKTGIEAPHRLIPQCVDALRRIWGDGRRKLVFEDWPYDRNQPSWKALNNLLKKCIDLAGARDIGRFHAIRKTALTLIYDRDRYAAQKMGGHSDIKLTEKHYIDQSKLTQSLPGDLLPRLSL